MTNSHFTGLSQPCSQGACFFIQARESCGRGWQEMMSAKYNVQSVTQHRAFRTGHRTATASHSKSPWHPQGQWEMWIPRIFKRAFWRRERQREKVIPVVSSVHDCIPHDLWVSPLYSRHTSLQTSRLTEEVWNCSLKQTHKYFCSTDCNHDDRSVFCLLFGVGVWYGDVCRPVACFLHKGSDSPILWNAICHVFYQIHNSRVNGYI